ncbi:cell division protein FtsA [Endomicrobium proavitum]|uniref:Cell division protein FtsA n=1 Tax=Endomicrobium proavitum TaxID=1408281 RepID=A0A0G3WK96_9BACT|nr:cell division protein FtsA [Endomicrobium proavitum]AKL98302.1 Cell division protein ftsA [Endomicrobium proavitum]
MAKQTLIAGLDIGSNQVCCVAGVRDDQTRLVKVLGSAVVPSSDGIKSGAVINIQEAAMAISKAIEEAEKSAGGQISSVTAAIRGNFIESRSVKASANINHSDKEVTEDTVINALDNARQKIKINSDHEVLQIIPREFILDGQKGIQNPIGMEGNVLEVDVHALVASSSNIGNIFKAMNLAGVNCDDRVYSYHAAGEILVTKEEKELGCLVVDFGGLTTGLVHYAEAIIRYTNEVQVGSDHITRDIMHKLRASFSVSKEVKETRGAAFKYDGFQNAEFDYDGADGISVKKFDKFQLVDIIQPRVEQILFAIEDAMKKSSFGAEFLSGGIILTGGGSRLDGIVKAFEKYFGCAARPGRPDLSKVVGADEIIENPVYTAAIGAIASPFSNTYPLYRQKSSAKGWFTKLKGMLEGI